MPVPEFPDAFDDVVLDAVGARRKVTTERVDRVAADGTLEVRGHLVKPTGRVSILAGDRVAVAWHKGQPIAVYFNEGRRAKSADVEGQVEGDVVEELYIDGVAGKRDVYFRNDHVIQALKVRPFLTADPEAVVWGTSRDAFVVRVGTGSTLRFSVFTMQRKKDTPQTKPGRVTLRASYTPWEKATTLVTLTLNTENVARTFNRHVEAHHYDHEDFFKDGDDPSQPDPGYPAVEFDGILSCQHMAAVDLMTQQALILRKGDRGTLVVTIKATQALFTGVAPAVIVTGVQLNDALELFLTLRLDVDKALAALGITSLATTNVTEEYTSQVFTEIWLQGRPLNPGNPPFPDSHLISGSAASCGGNVENIVIGAGTPRSVKSMPEVHILLLNITTGAVVWRTCADATYQDSVWSWQWGDTHKKLRLEYTAFWTALYAGQFLGGVGNPPQYNLHGRCDLGPPMSLPADLNNQHPVTLAEYDQIRLQANHELHLDFDAINGQGELRTHAVDAAVLGAFGDTTAAWYVTGTNIEADFYSAMHDFSQFALTYIRALDTVASDWAWDDGFVFFGFFVGHIVGAATFFEQADFNPQWWHLPPSGHTPGTAFYDAQPTEPHWTGSPPTGEGGIWAGQNGIRLTQETWAFTAIAHQKGQTITRNIKPTFEATHVARRSGKGLMVLSLVEQVVSPAGYKLGLVVFDLDRGTTTTLQPLTASASAPTLEVLGATSSHVLWYRSYPGVSEVVLTSLVTGTSKVVGTAVDEFRADPYRAAPSSRHWHLLRPDFLYLRDRKDRTKGNHFIVGWDVSTGAPTLEQAGAFPILDPALRTLGTLKALSASQVEQEAKLDAQSRLVPGPSLQVLQSSRLPKSRRQRDE